MWEGRRSDIFRRDSTVNMLAYLAIIAPTLNFTRMPIAAQLTEVIYV